MESALILRDLNIRENLLIDSIMTRPGDCSTFTILSVIYGFERIVMERIVIERIVMERIMMERTGWRD